MLKFNKLQKKGEKRLAWWKTSKANLQSTKS